MTGSSDRWQKLLDAILLAPSLGEAYSAASEIIDEALPGGSVLDNSVEIFLDEIIDRVELVNHPFRACVIGVLVAIAPWSNAWRSAVVQGNVSEAVERGVEAETNSLIKLSRLCSRMSYLMDDSDPEVRSLMYLLTGRVGHPLIEVLSELQRRAVVDADRLARACAVQGVVLSLERLSPEGASQPAAWVRGLATNDVLIRHRIRKELESVARSPGEQRRLAEIVAVRGHERDEQDEVSGSWPTENI